MEETRPSSRSFKQSSIVPRRMCIVVQAQIMKGQKTGVCFRVWSIQCANYKLFWWNFVEVSKCGAGNHVSPPPLSRGIPNHSSRPLEIEPFIVEKMCRSGGKINGGWNVLPIWGVSRHLVTKTVGHFSSHSFPCRVSRFSPSPDDFTARQSLLPFSQRETKILLCKCPTFDQTILVIFFTPLPPPWGSIKVEFFNQEEVHCIRWFLEPRIMWQFGK